MKRTAVLAVAVAVVTGVGVASQAATVTDSGLTGKVLRGPTTPVCRAGVPCYAPFKGTLVFTPITAGNAPVTPVRTQTTPKGNYKVALDPSRYRVTTGARSRFGNLVKPAVVTVPQQAGMRRVNFVVDTGIR